MISPWEDLVTDGFTTICRFSTQFPLVICSLTIFLLVDSFFSEWQGSGVEATYEQQMAIPPISSEETTAGAATGSTVETIYADPPQDNTRKDRVTTTPANVGGGNFITTTPGTAANNAIGSEFATLAGERSRLTTRLSLYLCSCSDQNSIPLPIDYDFFMRYSRASGHRRNNNAVG